MSLFSRFFQKKSVIEADDLVFGHITYELGVWTFIPKPPTEGYMITVDALETGPTQQQRDFFQEIRSRISEFEQQARNFIRSHNDEGVDSSRLSVYSVEIGNEIECQLDRFVLEMCDEDAIIIYRVSFAGAEPVAYGFDD